MTTFLKKRTYILLDLYYEFEWNSDYIPPVGSSLIVNEKTEAQVTRIENKMNTATNELDVIIYCRSEQRERSDAYPL